ncbi:glycoprotease family-domain-containing protein [Daedaleopsis nitida]|nr:glycoprotease family-domain-containing protein [Daedaleopsis nitida]
MGVEPSERFPETECGSLCSGEMGKRLMAKVFASAAERIGRVCKCYSSIACHLTSPPASVPAFPFLTLLVSGGHTLLLFAASRTAFHILATTLDESISNTFDKVAKLLRIPYANRAPGAILEHLRILDARSFRRTAVTQLEEKLGLGLRLCARESVAVCGLVVSGGVASNAFLRGKLRACLDEESPDEPVPLVFPPPQLCTDNAAMDAPSDGP